MLQELHSPVIFARAAKCAHLDHLLVLIESLGALLIFISGNMPASMPVDKCIIQLVTCTQTTLYRCNVTPHFTPHMIGTTYGTYVNSSHYIPHHVTDHMHSSHMM